MRLFIAINFDAGTIARMLDVGRRLQTAVRGRFSRPENLHLTLQFLGEVAPERVGDVRAAMHGVEFQPFTLTFDRVGRFDGRDGDIRWIGIKQSDALFKLHSDLSAKLRGAGFPLDDARFSPHVTLARDVRPIPGADAENPLPAPFSARVDEIHLMLSERKNGVLTYTRLDAARA